MTEDIILPPSDSSFNIENKHKWFDQKEFIKMIGIDYKQNPLYPSDLSGYINDRIITLSFKAAIELNADLFADKIVLDLNSGIGLNSLFAAENGAKYVYALETNTTLTKYSRKVIQQNGYDHIINVINNDIYNVVLQEKVDIIICNWMGNFITQNSLLKELIYARDKYLSKNNGIILPDKATLFIAGLEDVQYKDDKLSMWDNVYDINMKCVKNESLCSPLIDTVNKQNIISTICPIYTVDVYSIKEHEINFSNEYELRFLKNDTFSGFVCWFDVKFSKLPNQIKFTTSPYNEATKWRQVVFYIENDERVKKGDLIKGSICSRKNEELENMKGIDVKISYEFVKSNGKGSKGVQMYKIIS